MKLSAWKQITLLTLASFSVSIGSMAQNTSATLRAGTPVTLVFLNDLSSANASTGTTVTLVLSQNLTVNGAIAVKSGTKVFAKVTTAVKARAAGRSGAITLHLEPLRAGNQTIPLRASLNGNDNDDVRYERPYHLKFPMGVFRTGDDVEIHSSTSLTVFVAEDVHISAFD